MQTLIEAEDKPLGVIESLQQGFNFLNRHLWFLIPPVLLDLFLWLSPRVTTSPLVNQLVAWFEAQQANVQDDLAQNIEVSLAFMRQLGETYSLLSLLAGLLTRIPSLMARIEFQAIPSPMGGVIALDNVQTVGILVAVLIPIGVALGSFWLTMVAFGLLHRPLFSFAFVRRWGWVWLNVNLFLLAIFLAALGMSFVMSMFAVITLMFGNAGLMLYSIASILLFGFIIWLGIGLYFVVFAVALDGVNLARAVWRSLNVVGRNAISTLGFLLLTFLLTEGFARIWSWLSIRDWGVVVSIFGHAYLGVAIVAASFLFYQSRYQHWRKIRALVMVSQSDESH